MVSIVLKPTNNKNCLEVATMLMITSNNIIHHNQHSAQASSSL